LVKGRLAYIRIKILSGLAPEPHFDLNVSLVTVVFNEVFPLGEK
jgi:hypothetical protein